MNAPYDPYGRQADTREVFDTGTFQTSDASALHPKKEWTGPIRAAIATVIATIGAAIIGAGAVIYVQNVDANKEAARDKREAYLGFLEEVTSCTEPNPTPPPSSDPEVPELKPAAFMPADPESSTGLGIQINAERCEKIEAAFDKFAIHAPRELTEEAKSILSAISRLPSTSNLGLSVVLNSRRGPYQYSSIWEVHDLISKFRVMICKDLSVDKQSCNATTIDRLSGTP